MKLLGIKFKGNTKEYVFGTTDDFGGATHAVVLSDGVETLVEITNFNAKANNLSIIQPIVRVATEKDIKNDCENRDLEAKASIKFNELQESHNLGMVLIDCEYTLKRDSITFIYFAESRVDFRELLKDLRGHFRTDITLRQVGTRDKAKIVGGIGPCGLELCCKNHLREFDNISIKMAKSQNLSLNPNTITGCCGKLKCCLSYENETYKELKKGMPKVGSECLCNGAKCKIMQVNPINNTVKIKSKDGFEEVLSSELKECKN